MPVCPVFPQGSHSASIWLKTFVFSACGRQSSHAPLAVGGLMDKADRAAFPQPFRLNCGRQSAPFSQTVPQTLSKPPAMAANQPVTNAAMLAELVSIRETVENIAYNTDRQAKELRAIEKATYFMEQRSDAVGRSQVDIVRLSGIPALASSQANRPSRFVLKGFIFSPIWLNSQCSYPAPFG